MKHRTLRALAAGAALTSSPVIGAKPKPRRSEGRRRSNPRRSRADSRVQQTLGLVSRRGMAQKRTLLERIDAGRVHAMVASLGGSPEPPLSNAIFDSGRAEIVRMPDDELVAVVEREPGRNLGLLRRANYKAGKRARPRAVGRDRFRSVIPVGV